MSMINAYRNNITHKSEDIARLQQQKANEQHKITAIASKIIAASQAHSRIKNTSAAAGKLREIERHERDRASSERKIADIESKIARKQKEITDEQRKLRREEQSLQKKQFAESERQTREHRAQMSNLGEAIRQHDYLHRETISTLERLQKLPETIVVLFLASNPIDQSQLRLDEEARSIAEMIRKAEHRDSVRFETRWAIRPTDIIQAINELQPTIVHFSGHGTDTDEIVLQSNSGTTKTVSKEAIAQTMTVFADNIRLVFFNTCYSNNQAKAVTMHIEAAIGMNTSISDGAARIFSSQFYSAISFGHSVQRAFEQAKTVLMLEGIPEEETPELFVQDGIDPNDIVIVRPAQDHERFKTSS